jgi:hypothetical protein
MLAWNVIVVDKRPGRACYLVPLSHEVVFRNGLPRPLIVGELIDAVEEVIGDARGGLDYDRFKPNPEFLRFLHAALAKHVARCPGVLQEARRQRDGYVYIIDARTPTPSGKVPTADGVGAVQIEGGNPIAYHANPHYEPYGRNGLMRLDAWLEARFMEEVLELMQRRA